MLEISGNVQNSVLIGPNKHTKSQEFRVEERPPSWKFGVFALFVEIVVQEGLHMFQIMRFGFMYESNTWLRSSRRSMYRFCFNF